jgi:signal transduction histidine kinase/DNA-binding NarL/FixJ family response regulator
MKILIIDDEETVRRSLERYVRFRGDQTFTAATGRSGLHLLTVEPIDLVITDINMPDIDGLEVLQQVQLKYPDLPVIVVTAYANTDLAIKAVNQGAFAFLQKPILAQTLNGKINEAFERVHDRLRVYARLANLEHTAQTRQERLEQEQAFSAAILRHAPFPVCLLDAQGLIHMANPPFRANFGGNTDLGQAVPDLDLQQLKTGQSIQFSLKSGSQVGRSFRVSGFDVDSAPYVRFRCLFFQDTTIAERVAAEHRLRQECFSRVYEFRTATAPLVHSPQLLPRLTELALAALRPLNPLQLRLRIGGNECRNGTAQETDSPYLNFEIGGEIGETGSMELYADAPVHIEIQRDFAGKLAEIIGQRLMDRAIQLRLIQNNQLRALGEMAAGVAHELNQPLSGIRVFAEGLLYGLNRNWPTPQGELAETLGDIVAQVDRMSDIIGHMRDFSPRSDRDTVMAFSLATSIDNILKLVRTQLADHGIILELEVTPDLPEIRGWPRQLEQVLLNLILNARQAIEQHAPARPLLRLCLHSHDNSEIHLVVADNGGGIPPKIFSHIFEPFFTSKAGGVGTGLGLSISHHIIQEHSGRIEVNNQPGQGAIFTVILPAHDKDIPL